jgi:hypothetical protein
MAMCICFRDRWDELRSGASLRQRVATFVFLAVPDIVKEHCTQPLARTGHGAHTVGHVVCSGGSEVNGNMPLLGLPEASRGSISKLQIVQPLFIARRGAPLSWARHSSASINARIPESHSYLGQRYTGFMGALIVILSSPKQAWIEGVLCLSEAVPQERPANEHVPESLIFS